jgi:hypothetical protein
MFFLSRRLWPKAITGFIKTFRPQNRGHILLHTANQLLETRLSGVSKVKIFAETSLKIFTVQYIISTCLATLAKNDAVPSTVDQKFSPQFF